MIKSFRNAHSEGRALILRLCIIYYERLVVRFIQDAPLLWSGAHRIINPKQDFYQCVCAIVDYLESLFKSRLTKMYILDEPDQIVWFFVTSVYNHHDVSVCERCERAIGPLERDFPKSSNFLRLKKTSWLLSICGITCIRVYVKWQRQIEFTFAVDYCHYDIVYEWSVPPEIQCNSAHRIITKCVYFLIR